MNLACLHMPLLESYLQSPRSHVEASANQALRGGYFINIREGMAGEVRDLRDSINRDRADMLRFAQAIDDGQELLCTSASGFDLTPFYPKLPADVRVPGAALAGHRPTRPRGSTGDPRAPGPSRPRSPDRQPSLQGVRARSTGGLRVHRTRPKQSDRCPLAGLGVPTDPPTRQRPPSLVRHLGEYIDVHHLTVR